MIMIKIIKFFTIAIFVFFANLCLAQKNIVEFIKIDTTFQNKILTSRLKAPLKNAKGEKIIAYLYAEDEEVTESVTSPHWGSGLGGDLKCIDHEGHYFIYLFDVNHKIFYPYRTKVMKIFGETLYVDNGNDEIIVVHGNKKNKSDILLINQFITTRVNYFEAYGFSENQQYLENYIFARAKKKKYFYGKPYTKEPEVTLYGVYGDKNDQLQTVLAEVSENKGEILLTPIKH